MISGTIFENHRTLSAQPLEAFYISVSHFDALSVGLNCAVGVDLMRPDDRDAVAESAARTSAAIPTPACPTAMGGFKGDRDHTVAALGEFARNGWLNIVGGCCGTTPDWIHGIAEAVKDVPPRKLPDLPDWSCYSGTEPLVVRPETNFVMIGERTNITGSQQVRPAHQGRQFRRGPGRGPRAGGERRQHHRRQHGRRPDRRRGGDDALPQPRRRRAGHRQGPGHDRQLEMVGHRGGAEVRPGQGHRQLDQPQRRRGKVPRTGPARQALRRRRGGDGVRRGGPGRRPPTARSRSPPAPTSC